jgi:RNA-directed DNA polymerase
MAATKDAVHPTEERDAGAVSHEEEQWYGTDWYQANRNVRRLQIRIVKATQEGRWGKVKALQRLLTHSYSGKLLAVKRVTENQGRNTPGVDGITWNTPEKKMAAVHALKQRGYHPQPLKRVYIPKKNGKMRPLGIPVMKCRAMQALYLLALDPIAEATGDPNSYGFRSQRSTADAIGQCFCILAKRASAQWILEGDIKACFDRISHDWLLNHIPMEKSMLKKWLKAGYMEQKTLYPTEDGTPQGGTISPVLANLTLDGLERILKEKYPKPKSGFNAKVNYVRFADDFIITGYSKEFLEEEVKPLVETFMKERGLELSPDKTVITHIDDGFDFLGQNVRKYHGKLLIKPSKKNVQAFLDKVRGIIQDNKQATAGHLVCQLNRVLRGWARYHRHVVSKATFNRVQRFIYQALWRWARRRHPNKGARWVKQKYFCSVRQRNWVFFGEVTQQEETTRVYLTWITDTPIERHIKIKESANPYDPSWETYFEKRLDLKMERNLRKRRLLLHLWEEQHGVCPHCQQKLTELTGWHSHHIIWRSKGGSDGTANRVLLHPDCHRAIHSQGLTVTKPCPTIGANERLEPDE